MRNYQIPIIFDVFCKQEGLVSFWHLFVFSPFHRKGKENRVIAYRYLKKKHASDKITGEEFLLWMLNSN